MAKRKITKQQDRRIQERQQQFLDKNSKPVNHDNKETFAGTVISWLHNCMRDPRNNPYRRSRYERRNHYPHRQHSFRVADCRNRRDRK